jgi:hypothetical protein
MLEQKLQNIKTLESMNFRRFIFGKLYISKHTWIGKGRFEHTYLCYIVGKYEYNNLKGKEENKNYTYIENLLIEVLLWFLLLKCFNS